MCTFSVETPSRKLNSNKGNKTCSAVRQPGSLTRDRSHCNNAGSCLETVLLLYRVYIKPTASRMNRAGSPGAPRKIQFFSHDEQEVVSCQRIYQPADQPAEMCRISWSPPREGHHVLSVSGRMFRERYRGINSTRRRSVLQLAKAPCRKPPESLLRP